MTTEDFDPPEVERPDGTRTELTPGRYRRALSHPDRGYRKRAYEAYHAAFDRFARTLGTAYAEKLVAASTLADVRSYDSVRQLQFRHEYYPETGLALAPLGSDYQQKAEEFFAADRIDASPHENRRNDIGYCPSSADDGAFILMNYQDDVESMFICATSSGTRSTSSSSAKDRRGTWRVHGRRRRSRARSTNSY